MTRALALVAAACWTWTFPASAKTPTVVASIAPIHSLIAGVMDGIGEPRLLIRGGASPHTYNLKPSDAKALADARVIFWIGENLESFLAKPLETLAPNATVVRLIGTDGLRLLPQRTAGAWRTVHSHGHDHGRAHPDAHIWLAPANARILAAAIVDVLAAADPTNAGAYRTNGQRVDGRLAALEADMKVILAPIKNRPFVVFHDAYQYLEDAFGLNAVGAIAVAPEKPPGPKALSALRARMQSSGARCVFREPQFPAKLAETVADGTGARIAVLDPEGIVGAVGPNLYVDLMRSNARALADCLGGD